MGTEISEGDIAHIHALCDQVISITEYRSQLAEYLRNRMNAIAPNLTALVGELVGARLISHAGSLMSLAKQPASTIQILGAEKALFRALKTKHDTPKYGLIFHVSSIASRNRLIPITICPYNRRHLLAKHRKSLKARFVARLFVATPMYQFTTPS
jgi:RNA processing factor Prp31